MRDPAHQLKTAMLSPDRLHSLTLDILKALKTYKKPYLAAFRYQARARFAAIARPTMLLVTPNLLPNLRAAATELAASTPWAKIVESESGNPAIARAILEFVTPEAGARNPA
jgi:hypothetical protein